MSDQIVRQMSDQIVRQMSDQILPGRMFLYAQIYWLAEFGDVSCLQFNYLRVETLTPTWEDLVGHLSNNLVGHLSVIKNNNIK
jgi:hypothetical protein